MTGGAIGSTGPACTTTAGGIAGTGVGDGAATGSTGRLGAAICDIGAIDCSGCVVGSGDGCDGATAAGGMGTLVAVRDAGSRRPARKKVAAR